MTFSQAREIIVSRNGVPREDDWDLAEASIILLKHMEESHEAGAVSGGMENTRYVDRRVLENV